jgi:hypothetical protein
VCNDGSDDDDDAIAPGTERGHSVEIGL